MENENLDFGSLTSLTGGRVRARAPVSLCCGLVNKKRR